MLPFTKITEGADSGKWKATVRLLGVTGTEQLLTGEIRYADGALPSTFRFTHRTALVAIELTDYTEGLESVKLTGFSTGGGNPAEIVPYDKGSYTYTVSLAAAEDPGYTEVSEGNYTVDNEKGLKNLAELMNSGETNINITLTVNQSETNYVGLIDYLGSGGKVQNLTLENVNITGNNFVGGVVGYNCNGIVAACYWSNYEGNAIRSVHCDTSHNRYCAIFLSHLPKTPICQ